MNLEHLSEEEKINRLLSIEDLPEKTVMLDRVQVPVTLKALTGKQVFKIREMCTYRKEKKGKVIENFDEEQFNAALVVAATISPNWGDQKLLAKYKASEAEEVVKRILLAGELASLADIVLELSGFYTDLSEVKNS